VLLVALGLVAIPARSAPRVQRQHRLDEHLLDADLAQLLLVGSAQLLFGRLAALTAAAHLLSTGGAHAVFASWM
jgi:hypothetical protein